MKFATKFNVEEASAKLWKSLYDVEYSDYLALLRDEISDAYIAGREAVVQPEQEFPKMLNAERRTTLVNSLRATKGWTVAYAEAFVDEFAQPKPEPLTGTQPVQPKEVK